MNTASINNMIGIIADDITGSGDSGVQFRKRGLKTTIYFDPHSLDSDIDHDGAIVVNTDSRALDKDQAYNVCFETTSKLKDMGASHFYKKLDSTLRGNIGAEIQGCADAIDPDFVIIAPAFPKIGRQTMEGHHYLNGKKLNDTEVANDPKTPVTESFLPYILLAQASHITIDLISIEMLRDSTTNWTTELAKRKGDSPRWLVIDAEKEEDLALIAENFSGLPFQFLWVGSAGLAEYLSAKWSPDSISEPLVYEPGSPVLIVAGSLSPVTEKQVAELLNEKEMCHIQIDPLELFHDNVEELNARISLEAIKAIHAGCDVLLYADADKEQVKETVALGSENGLSAVEVSNLIANRIGTITKTIVEQSQVNRFVLTGGDTAKDVCHHIDVIGLEPICEIEPGIPLGKLIGMDNGYAVTKAGAFGNDYSLRRAVQVLKGGIVL